MTPIRASAYESAAGDPAVGEELAEVRIIAATPDITQRVAQLLRLTFRCDEPHSYSRSLVRAAPCSISPSTPVTPPKRAPSNRPG